MPVNKLEKPYILVQVPKRYTFRISIHTIFFYELILNLFLISLSNNGSQNSSYKSEHSYRPNLQQKLRLNSQSERNNSNQIYVNQMQFDNASTLTNKSNDERTNRRNENIIPEETQQQQQQNQNEHYDMDAQTQILQQKQYSNPYLQRMKLQQQKQQELIREQLKNQNDINLEGIDSNV